MSTKLKTIIGRCNREISVKRFYGGKSDGTMISLTIGNSGIQLTRFQVKELAELLNDAFDYEKHPSD